MEAPKQLSEPHSVETQPDIRAVPASSHDPLSSTLGDPPQKMVQGSDAKPAKRDESGTSFVESDESLGVPHGSERLEASFGRLSVSSSLNGASARLSETDNSLSKSVTAATNIDEHNINKQITFKDPSLSPSNSSKGVDATAAAAPENSEPRLPSPSPSIRAYMLEYRNEPRPPPSSAPRTPLSLSLAGLRRAPLDGLVVATTSGDYFHDNPLLSPRLEAIDEITEEISAHAIETPAAVQAIQPLNLPSMKQTTTASQEASLLSILSSSSLQSAGSLFAKDRNPKLDDSMFDSPLAIPQRDSVSLSPDASTPLHSLSAIDEEASSPSVGRIGQHTSRARPSPLSFKPTQPLDLHKVNDKIQDILWNVDNQEESELLTPDESEIGPASPFFGPPGGLSAQQEKEMASTTATAPAVATSNQADLKPANSTTAVDTAKSTRKIPTLVGPNALPYARCPSGIDSFAFDLSDPRRYEAIMPPGKSSFVTVAQQYEVPITSSQGVATQHASLAVPAAPTADISADLSGVSRASRSSHSSVLSANARARQRTEEKKQLVIRREQSRMEQQGRREAARLMRKLRDQTNDSPKDMGLLGASAADMSAETQIGDEQLQWHFDAEKGGWVKRDLPARRAIKPEVPASVLRSDAQPFFPSPRLHDIPESGHNHFERINVPFNLEYSASTTANPVVDGGHAYQNRLMQILQTRQVSGHPVQAQHQQWLGSMTAQNQASVLPMQNAAMVQAIQEISQFNQHLLALMSMQTAANRAALAQVATMQPITSVNTHMPLVAESQSNTYLAGRALSNEYDPAIVHSYRRPETATQFDAINLSSLPARPAPAALSPRLTGIVPQSGEASTPEALQKARESQRSDTTASTTDSTDTLLEKERKTRSNAPSPELAMPCTQLDATKSTASSDAVSTAKTGRTQQRVLQPLNGNTMARSSASTGKSGAMASKKQEKTGGMKQERKRDTGRFAQSSNAKSRQSAKTARTANPRNDSDWTAFVEQRMSGMAVKGGNQR